MENPSPHKNSGSVHPAKWDGGMDFADFIGVSDAVIRVRQQAANAANDPLGESVLITGETGTGKDLLAGIIHQHSDYVTDKKIFIHCDCSNLQAETCISSLFGHARGAFTTAYDTRKGEFASAENGTLFLNEIGNLPTQIQPVLLRVVEYRKYKPLGSDKEFTSNARMIFATNKNLRKLCETGQFKSDLYYRFRRRCIHIPPLRDRRDDILALLTFFSDLYSKRYGMKMPIKIEKEVIAKLKSYDFPGNVREMANIISDGINILYNEKRNVLTAGDIFLTNPYDVSDSSPSVIREVSADEAFLDVVKQYIANHKAGWCSKKSGELSCVFDEKKNREQLRNLIWESTGRNKAKTAKLLGLTPDALREL